MRLLEDTVWVYIHLSGGWLQRAEPVGVKHPLEAQLSWGEILFW